MLNYLNPVAVSVCTTSLSVKISYILPRVFIFRIYLRIHWPFRSCYMAAKLGLFKARDARRITAAEMKYMRRTARYTWTDYKTNAQVAKELKLTPVLDKLLEYKRSWTQHVNRMPRNRLPRVMKHYSSAGRRNHGRNLKRLLVT